MISLQLPDPSFSGGRPSERGISRPSCSEGNIHKELVLIEADAALAGVSNLAPPPTLLQRERRSGTLRLLLDNIEQG